MLSEARRTSTNSLYYSTVASRINNQHTGAIVVAGQRLHPDDLIGTLLRSGEDWTLLSLPAIAEKEERIPIGPGRCHVRRVGDLLHPQQQSREVLEALRSQDPETYAAQHQQSPIPPGGFMIKRDQIQYCDELPRRASLIYLQSWDPGQNPVYRIHDRHAWISPSRKRPAAYRCQSVRTSMLLSSFAALANRRSKLTIASHPSALAK